MTNISHQNVIMTKYGLVLKKELLKKYLYTIFKSNRIILYTYKTFLTFFVVMDNKVKTNIKKCVTQFENWSKLNTFNANFV